MFFVKRNSKFWNVGNQNHKIVETKFPASGPWIEVLELHLKRPQESFWNFFSISFHYILIFGFLANHHRRHHPRNRYSSIQFPNHHHRLDLQIFDHFGTCPNLPAPFDRIASLQSMDLEKKKREWSPSREEARHCRSICIGLHPHLTNKITFHVGLNFG